MTDSEMELVGRLRIQGSWRNSIYTNLDFTHKIAPLLEQAAAMIERLVKERDEARGTQKAAQLGAACGD